MSLLRRGTSIGKPPKQALTKLFAMIAFPWPRKKCTWPSLCTGQRQAWLRVGFALALAFILLPIFPHAAHTTEKLFTPAELDPLINALREEGFPLRMLRKLLYDRRLRRADKALALNVRNPDGRARYLQAENPRLVASARAFLEQYADVLQALERSHGVSGRIIVAILLLETHLGQLRPQHRVLEVLITLAAASAPVVVKRHEIRLLRMQQSQGRSWVKQRLNKKSAFGYRELHAFLKIYGERPEAAYEARGSYAGAMGIPQFLPSSYLRWSADGNRDGKKNLNHMEDAIASTANYLRGHGWLPRANFEKKWRAIWAYNHSPHYVRAVWEIAFRLNAPAPKMILLPPPAAGKKSA